MRIDGEGSEHVEYVVARDGPDGARLLAFDGDGASTWVTDPRGAETFRTANDACGALRRLWHTIGNLTPRPRIAALAVTHELRSL